MKKKVKLNYISFILYITTVLAGCSAAPSASGDITAANPDYIAIGSSLIVHNTDTRLTLLDNKDTLSADGLYYAAWTAGDSEPYENSDGDTVDLYDAQLYLLLGEFKNSDAAQQNMNNWLTAGQTNYDVITEDTVTYNEQSYTIITYNFANEENPYSHGVSAFGVHNNLAVCVELTCREDYPEDLQQMLADFLNSCAYN